MDRESAWRNIRSGLLAASLALLMFALAFYATILYIS
jgi:uncharacterized membrane protein